MTGGAALFVAIVAWFLLGPFVALGFAALLSWLFEDALRGLLWDVWGNSTLIVCPGHYVGKEWEPEACSGCPWNTKCKGVMSNVAR